MRRIGVLLPVLFAFQAGVPPALAWTWPVGGPVLQYFEFGDDPYAGGQHRGIDVGAPAGSVVVAPAAGTVSFAGTVPGGGRTVTIETADGYSVTLVHLGLVAVGRGATVGEGERVGTIGPSGTAEVAEPYVHLGIRLTADENGYVDPLGLLPSQAEEPPATDPAAGVGGEAVPAADPVEAVPVAVDPVPTTVGDPPSAESPAQPQTAAQDEEMPAQAAEGVPTQQVISPPASAEGNPVLQPPSVGAGAAPVGPPAVAPAPQPASPAALATSEPATDLTEIAGPRSARSPDRTKRDALSKPGSGGSSRAHRATAARMTSSLTHARGRVVGPSRTPVTRGLDRNGAEPQEGLGPGGSEARISVENPAQIRPARLPGPTSAAGSGTPASVRLEVRRDGGLSAWVVALAAAGALAVGAWLGRRRGSRPQWAVANDAEPVLPQAGTEVEPPVREASTGEVSEEDLRALERELERLLSTSGTPGQTEHEPAELPQALEWAR